MSRQKFPGWQLDPDPLQVEDAPREGTDGSGHRHVKGYCVEPGCQMHVRAAVVPRRGCLYWVLACVVVLVAVAV